MSRTLNQCLADLEKVRQAMKLPGVPEEEKEIYANTIQRIEEEIKILNSDVGVVPSSPSLSLGVKDQGSRATENITVNTVITDQIRRVKINWGAGREDLLTEGETRSRFTTALRDLSESRMVLQGRFERINEYIVFQRAVAYYRALEAFWGRPPTPQQLSLMRMGKLRAIIFSAVAEAARAEKIGT